MGRSKASLPFGNSTILARIVAELKRAFSPIIVVAAPESVEPLTTAPGDVTIVHDPVAYPGPVAALRTGLTADTGEYAFACSCDLPLIRAEVVLALCEMLGRYDAVIPRAGGRLQMLHAVYHRRCADTLAAMEERGEHRLGALAEAIKVRIIEEDDLKSLDGHLLSFFNVNTPEAYQHALRLAASHQRAPG